MLHFLAFCIIYCIENRLKLLFLHRFLCTQLFEAIVKSVKAVFKQLKPCSNHLIHVLFEHGF